MDENEAPPGRHFGFVVSSHNNLLFVFGKHGTVLLNERSRNTSGGDPPAKAEWICFVYRAFKPANPQSQSKQRLYVGAYEKIHPPSDIPITVSIDKNGKTVGCPRTSRLRRQTARRWRQRRQQRRKATYCQQRPVVKQELTDLRGQLRDYKTMLEVVTEH